MCPRNSVRIDIVVDKFGAKQESAMPEEFEFQACRVRWRVIYVMGVLFAALAAAIFSFLEASPNMVSGLPPFSGDKIGLLGSIIYRGFAIVGAGVVVHLIRDFIVDFPTPKPIMIITEDGVWIRHKMGSSPIPWKLIKGFHFDKITQKYGLFSLTWKYLEFQAAGYESYIKRVWLLPTRLRVYTYNLDKSEGDIGRAIKAYLDRPSILEKSAGFDEEKIGNK